MVSDRHQLRVIKRAMKGDAEAFVGLCNRYADALYRYLYFRLGSVLEAEEVCAQVFVRAWESLPSDPRQRVMSFAAWLFLIANDVVVERQEQSAQAGRHPPRPPMVSWSDHGGTAKQLRLHPRHLAQAIMQLDEVSQQVILLRFILRMSHRDTGLIIGDTGAGSRVLQYRGLLEVREGLTRKKMSEHAYASDYVGAATFCLDRIIAGHWSADHCLEHLPKEGERLAPILKFAVMVREASRVRPRQSFEDDLQGNLAQLLRNSRRRPIQQPKFWRWFLAISERVPTPIVASFLLGLILLVGIAGSSGVALAIDGAAPGDRLYELDLRLEQAYSAFLTDPQSRLQFTLELTDERLAEAEKLAERGDSGGLQVALVAYSVEVASLVSGDASRDTTVASIDVDRHFSVQQQRLDKLLVTALASSPESAESETSVVGCEPATASNEETALHPVGLTLASQYGVDYGEVIGWVCDGHSFGEIVLALATVKTVDQVSTAELIALKSELGGWGQLWQEMKTNGAPEPAGVDRGGPLATVQAPNLGTPPAPTPEITPTPLATVTAEQTRITEDTGAEDSAVTRPAGPADDAGPPDHAGPPENAGPPDHAGPPEDAGPPDHAGPPENAGPPDDAGPPDHAGPPDNAGPPDDGDSPGRDNNPGNGRGRPGD